MKNLSMIPLSMVLLCPLTGAAQTGTPHKHSAAKGATVTPAAHKESPIACDLSALSPGERKRLGELGPILRELKTGMRELKDGYEFQFPPDPTTFELVSEWANQERLCCPFFEIGMHLGRDGGPLLVQLTGREGTKEFIRDDFAKWFKD